MNLSASTGSLNGKRLICCSNEYLRATRGDQVLLGSAQRDLKRSDNLFDIVLDLENIIVLRGIVLRLGLCLCSDPAAAL